MVLKEHELGFDTFKVLQIIFPLVIHYPTIQLFIIGWFVRIQFIPVSLLKVSRLYGDLQTTKDLFTID